MDLMEHQGYKVFYNTDTSAQFKVHNPRSGKTSYFYKYRNLYYCDMRESGKEENDSKGKASKYFSFVNTVKENRNFSFPLR